MVSVHAADGTHSVALAADGAEIRTVAATATRISSAFFMMPFLDMRKARPPYSGDRARSRVVGLLGSGCETASCEQSGKCLQLLGRCVLDDTSRLVLGREAVTAGLRSGLRREGLAVEAVTGVAVELVLVGERSDSLLDLVRDDLGDALLDGAGVALTRSVDRCLDRATVSGATISASRSGAWVASVFT